MKQAVTVTPEQILAADKAVKGKIPLILLAQALIAAEEERAKQDG